MELEGQKERRARRIEMLKVVVRDNVIRDQGGPQGMTVEMTDDAIIDLFSLGVLDSPEPEWDEFLQALRESHAEDVEEADDDD